MNIELLNDDIYNELAEFFFFQTNISSEKILKKLAYLGLTFRKNKGVDDVFKAREKAIKNGRQKVEFEIDMLSVYLKDIFKKERWS